MNIMVENTVLKIWQKEKSDMFDYYFEFIANETLTEVDILVCEQYYMDKLVETYYEEQPDYSTISKYCVNVSVETKHKIIQYYENPSIKILWD